MIPPNTNSVGFLLVLNQRPENIYAGTANPKAVAKRRIKNRMARISRRVNRQR